MGVGWYGNVAVGVTFYLGWVCGSWVGVAVDVTFCGVRVFRCVAVGVGFRVCGCVSTVNEC